MGHEAGDEVHVAAQAVELGYDDRRLELPGCGQRRGELRTPVEGVGALAGLDLGEGLGQDVAFGLGEAGERRGLSFKTKTGAAWLAVETRV
jgi:hypothetical protein